MVEAVVVEAPRVVSFRLLGGAGLGLSLPARAVSEPLETLPRFEVSGLSGARVSLRVGYVGEAGLRLRAACVEAPSDGWAPGVEDIVFSLGTGVLQRAALSDLTISRFSALSIAQRGLLLEQGLVGAGERAGEPVALSGLHLLGFEGARREAVFCSVLCEEPTAGSACAALVSGAELSSLVEAPPPSWFVRALMASAERPRHAALFFGVLGCLVVAVLLWRRPRPRP